MSELRYGSTNNVDSGLGTVTINSVSYIIDDLTGLSRHATRLLTRTDGDGDMYDEDGALVGDFLIRGTSEPIEVSLTLQKATSSTAIPEVGTEFELDIFQTGDSQPAVLVVNMVEVNRSSDSITSFSVNALIKNLVKPSS